MRDGSVQQVMTARFVGGPIDGTTRELRTVTTRLTVMPPVSQKRWLELFRGARDDREPVEYALRLVSDELVYDYVP